MDVSSASNVQAAQPSQVASKLPVPTNTSPIAAKVLSLKTDDEPVKSPPPEPVTDENLGSNINVFA